MQKHRDGVLPCILFSEVRYQTHLILSVCCIIDVVHPLLWKQIPLHSPQLSLAPFFSPKEHSHMPLFWLQGVNFTLPGLSSTALCAVLVIGARSWARCADLTLSQFVLLVFQCFVWRPTRISSLIRECLDFLRIFCASRDFFFRLSLSFSSYFALLFPLSRSKLNPSRRTKKWRLWMGGMTNNSFGKGRCRHSFCIRATPSRATSLRRRPPNGGQT